MLVLNKKMLFFDQVVLETFCTNMMKNPYDEETRVAYKTAVQYVTDLYEADKKLTELVQNRIGDDVVPIVSLDLCPTCDWNKLDFSLTSFNEDRKVLKREELLFYEYCDRCFGHIDGYRNVMDEALQEFY